MPCLVKEVQSASISAPSVSQPESSLAGQGSQPPGQPHQVMSELGCLGSMQINSDVLLQSFLLGWPRLYQA